VPVLVVFAREKPQKPSESLPPLQLDPVVEPLAPLSCA
jgi:hypothetical protein